MDKTPINKTREILFTIYDYCKKNNLAFFAKTRGYFYNLYVGLEEELTTNDDLVKSFKLTKEVISEIDFNLFLQQGHMNCSVKPTVMLKEQKERCFNEIFIEVFWHCEKDSTEKFFEHWDFECNNINLNYIVGYSNEKFPDGFADKNVTGYDKGLNWHHFLDKVPGKSIVLFFEKKDKRNKFFDLMKKLELNDIGKLNSHSFLHKIKLKLNDVSHETTLSQNAQVEMSYSLMELYKDKADFPKFYVKTFPFIQSLIDKKEKEELFTQDENIIEKVYLPINDIYKYFANEENILAEYYEKLTSEVIFNLGKNEQLKNVGLINIDLARNDRDFICYLNLETNNKINKQYFLNLYKDSIKMLIAEDVCSIKDKKEFIDSIKLIVSRNVSVKILSEELQNKSEIKIRKVKI